MNQLNLPKTAVRIKCEEQNSQAIKENQEEKDAETLINPRNKAKKKRHLSEENETALADDFVLKAKVKRIGRDFNPEEELSYSELKK